MSASWQVLNVRSSRMLSPRDDIRNFSKQSTVMCVLPTTVRVVVFWNQLARAKHSVCAFGFGLLIDS